MGGRVDTEALKDRISVWDVLTEIGATVTAREAVYCPFCMDAYSRNPGAGVYANGDRYHCFVCGFDGDIISLAQEHTGGTFQEACEWLATQFP